jgi:hypothetical protein
MSKILLVVAGIANLLFALFHIAMFWGIGHMPNVAEHIRSGMYTFNMLAVLALAFLAYALLARGKDVMTTGLGAATLAFGALVYLPRAAKDLVSMDIGWTFAICTAVGLLHALLLVQVRVAKQGT